MHFARPTVEVRPGDLVTVEITGAAPHHLIADGEVLDVRRTRAGDAWAARQAEPSSSVALGMPTVGVPEAVPALPGCQNP